MSRMPKQYRPGPAPGMELPLFWGDEVTGELPAAMMAYIDFAAGIRADPPTPAQVELIWDFLRHFINAPCWMTNCKAGGSEMEGQLKALIVKAAAASTHDQVREFVDGCMELGLDPF